MLSNNNRRLLLGLAYLGIAAIYGGAWMAHPERPVASFSVGAPGPAGSGPPQSPLFESSFASSDVDEYVHSSAVAALPGGDLLAVWFAGSREGAADVEIRGARLDAGTDEWGAEYALVTRETTQASVHKHIRKLGNPVITLAPDGRLWLFYVSVSIGGWGGSAINAMSSEDLGQTWSAPRQLITSPFLNISTLVRNTPVFHEDGSIGLPVYHEFLGKFAEYLYLSPDGEVIDKFRISKGKHSLQPTVVPLGSRSAVALLRNAGEPGLRVLASRTDDAGRTWSEPRPLEPFNPNSSLAAIHTPDHGLLVALNDSRDGRFRLSLYGTDVAMNTWQTLVDLDESPDPEGDPFARESFRAIFEQEFLSSSDVRYSPLLAQLVNHLDRRVCKSHGCEFEYEYPYFIRSTDGLYHLVYSWNNMLIKHVSFNDAWLDAQR